MAVDAAKLRVGVDVMMGLAIAFVFLWGTMKADQTASSLEKAYTSGHTELRHEVEKMRIEISRDIRDLTRSVDLGVSTQQAESWILLYRARLKGIKAKTIEEMVENMPEAVPDLPKRDG